MVTMEEERVELRRSESQCYAFSSLKAENASSIGILPLADFL